MLFSTGRILTHFFLKYSYISISCVLCIWYIGCASEQQKTDELNVFAAMSLSDALSEVGKQFTKTNKTTVYYNLAASTTLQRQIEKGASVDVFISASPIQVDTLESLDFVEVNSRNNLLKNRLVIVSHQEREIELDSVEQLSDPAISRIAIGQTEIVPAGTYAKEALTYFGVWDKLQSKFIYGLDVRSTLAYLTAGDVDLAIVYETDTILSDEVKIIYRFPDETHSSIIYPVVILKNSKRKQAAENYITFLKAQQATEIFKKHGFIHLIQE